MNFLVLTKAFHLSKMDFFKRLAESPIPILPNLSYDISKVLTKGEQYGR